MGKKELLYTTSDFYSEYKESRKDFPVEISKAQYNAILKDFFKELATAIIQKRYQFKIPYKMGFILIRKNRVSPQKKAIDWKRTKEEGKIVRHNNLHTDGYCFRWSWRKNNSYCSFKNSRFYTFEPTLDKHNREIGTRGLAAWIKKCAYSNDMKPYDAPLSK